MNSEIHETLDLQIAITKNQTVKIEIKSKPLQEIVYGSRGNLRFENWLHGCYV